jgi:MOSC domain-containing protein YiiM
MGGSGGNARIVSVNVGGVREAWWNNELVKTGIFKFPVDHPIAVRGGILEGDEQADRTVHGGADKAIYAYALEDYRWWASELGRDLQSGNFGENLTTEGIAVSDALIGECWVIGNAVLEVAQPRLPCYKLAMRMNDAVFPRRFARALRTGAYLRIVAEGEIGPGDPVRILSRPSEHDVSVRDLANIYLFDRAHVSKLADVPQLSSDWRDWALEQLRTAGKRNPTGA